MALKTHPKGSEHVYEDNLPWVMGVEVEIRKQKDTMMMRVAWIKVEVRTKKKVRFFYFDKEKIQGPTKFEVRTPTIPQQRR